MKLLGLEPEDIIPPSSLTVSTQIPDEERANKLRQKKQEALTRLREDRVKRLQGYLSTMSDAEATRYGRFVGDGVCHVRPEDLPDDQVLGDSSGEDIFASSKRLYAKIKAEQQRKAKSVAMGFLQQKQRSEDADAKLRELEIRMGGFKKEQKDRIKAIKKEAEARRDKCQANLAKSAQEREEYEARKMEEWAAASGRREGREEGSSAEHHARKIAAAEQTRRAAFMRAADMERRAIQRTLGEKTDAVEQRLAERLTTQQEELERRSKERHEKFQQRRLYLLNRTEDFVGGGEARRSQRLRGKAGQRQPGEQRDGEGKG
ncbi:unnamed protein product [Prorocentrum cordatum]|uniref:Uncharacterized protein n=1 Tax=Prorocentrum cordatum TaxID=2364126 RepID=A0ABN9U4N7_9DINO|nr:unnamed protein product [Polarella glacialis]